MKSKLIILGCGSSIGVPRIDGSWGKCNPNEKKNYRSRCSAIIIKNSNAVMIDTSPDIKSQLILNKIKTISSVIFTHDHADQTNGLFELRPFFWLSKKRINIYGDRNTLKSLVKRQSYLFKKSKSYPAILKTNIVKSSFSLGNGHSKISFNTFKVKHGQIFSVAYVFEKTAYISDCNDLSIVSNPRLKNLNNLVIDCLKFKKHPSHFNFEDAIYIHSKLNPKKTILTNMHSDLDYNYLRKNLPNNIIPSYDGLSLNL